MKIPFHRPYITDDEINSVVQSLKSGWLTMGEKTIEFEHLFASYLGVQNAVAVNSCTSALHLALRVIGLERGDEVIVPAITFVATAEVVWYFGAKPVLADVDPHTHLIDVSDLERKISSKTRAIIPVHFGGQPADMDEIIELARGTTIEVIEDAAHAMPSWYRGKMVGTLSDMTCFSFYATKTLSTGEGGMITTSREERADKLRSLRLHGISSDAWNRYSEKGSWYYDVSDVGYKYNTTDMNSSLGIEQLKKQDYLYTRRAAIAEKYQTAFSAYDFFIPYTVKPDRITSWHLYPLKLNIEALSLTRDDFIVEMKKAGIMTSVHFIPLYRFSFYRGLGYSESGFPGSEWSFNRVLSLPIYPGMTDDEVEYVAGAAIDIARKHRR